MRSKTFKTYLNVCLYKKRCGRYNILSRYFAGEKERISAKRKSVRYRKAAVRSCRDFQKGDLMYRHKTKKYRAAAVGAVLAAVLMLGWMLPTILPCVSPDFLRPGVTVYALLILLMMWLALQQESPWWALGALLFVASDTCLAWNKFVGPVMNARLWIMTTYYGALLLLYADSAFHRHEISPRSNAL